MFAEPVEGNTRPGKTAGRVEFLTVEVFLRRNGRDSTVKGRDGNCRVTDLENRRQCADEAVW